ncbi:protein obstructor-E-like [Planococcus citri]|uniref:protein obstructor-E-like n=1 Tax=Planococcus citri TaxID=170843 RepID=UPI0031F90F0B
MSVSKFNLFGVFALVICVNAQQLKNSNIQEDPCKSKSKVVGDATYCDRYWECVDGQPELYDCPNGLVYAGKNRGVTEGCDYPWRANYCEDKQLANGPISREHCDWLYGIFGHETSCTRYWTCWNGTATEQLCIGGLLYNENTRSCDWPENVEGCQKHPLCNEDPNGNVPLGKSCNRYWQCQGGYPRLQRCPAMLVFDKRSLRCVVPPTEDCEVPTTPPPSPDELQENEDEQNVPLPAQPAPRPNQISQARPQPQPQQRPQQPQQQRPQQFQLPQQAAQVPQQPQQVPQQRREEAFNTQPLPIRSRARK